MNPWLVVFDVDGTLVDSQQQIVDAMNAAFAQQGLGPLTRDAILSIVGLSLPEAFAVLAPGSDKDVQAHLVEGYKSHVMNARAAGKDASPLYEGAKETLFALNAKDEVVLGAATGKAMRGLNHVIDVFGLDGLFVTKQTSDLHPSKPHPAMLLATGSETGIPAERSIMIGDTSYDMEMGRAAKFHTIGVSWGYHDRARLGAAADVIVDDFAALKAHIDDMMSVDHG